jgi:hypothetical protein
MALRVWRQHYGDIPAVEFDSLKMLALQEIIIGTGWSRKTVNDSLARVKRALKWMVSRKLIPAAVMHECSAVTGLEKGRSRAKETEPKRPVPEEHIEAVRPWVSRQVWALLPMKHRVAVRAHGPQVCDRVYLVLRAYLRQAPEVVYVDEALPDLAILPSEVQPAQAAHLAP